MFNKKSKKIKTTKKFLTGKIAIPAMGTTLDAFISDSLGRAQFIIIYDVETQKFQCFENPGFTLKDGSGLKVTELILENKADILLTREIGTKAYSVLMKEHIDIHLLDSGGTVNSAIKKFLTDQQ
ncbi:MAG: NifB/NifX family molybdenum-iron cluster-binding protein [Ignavibacterium sp.]